MASTRSDRSNLDEDLVSTPLAAQDVERPTDPDNDDALPGHLDVGPEIPVPDVIDQRRQVVLDDERNR